MKAHVEPEKELTEDELQLYNLARDVGIQMNVKAFSSLVGLLQLNVSPVNITRMLQELVSVREAEKLKKRHALSRNSSSSSNNVTN